MCYSFVKGIVCDIYNKFNYLCVLLSVMKTVDKFILKSYLGPMFMTFFIVMFILLMNFLWRYIDELVGKGLPFSVIIELLFFATSTLMPLGLPLATLLAAIMTMGNLGESNELLALKAAGISLPRIMRPVIIVAILISLASFFVVNNYVPYSFQRMNNVLYDIRQQRQEIEFKDGIFFNGIPDVSIRVEKQDKKTKKLHNVLIYDTRDPDNTRTIVADSGYIDLSKDKQFLRVRLFHGQNYEDNRNFEWYAKPKLSHHIFDYEEMMLQLEGFNFQRSNASLFGNESGAKNIRQLGVDIDSMEVVTEGKVQKMVNNVMKQYLFKTDTLELMVESSDSVRMKKHYPFVADRKNFDTLGIEVKTMVFDDAMRKLTDLKYYVASEHDNIRATTVNLYKSYVDWHKKLALPVSILIFFLIGAPLGAIIRKGGLGTPIVISVAFFVIYYIITMMGEKLVTDGVWAPIYGVWLSSFVLFPLAIFLTYKSTTDSQLLNMEWYILKIKKVKEFFDRFVKVKNK